MKKLGSLITKLCWLISTYPSLTIRAFSKNFRLWSHISEEGIEGISINGKRSLQLNYDRLHVECSRNGELAFTNNKVLLSHSEPPKFNIALAIHVFAVALGPRDCCERNYNPSTVPQSDLRRWAALRWALPHISSYRFTAVYTGEGIFGKCFNFRCSCLRSTRCVIKLLMHVIGSCHSFPP